MILPTMFSRRRPTLPRPSSPSPRFPERAWKALIALLNVGEHGEGPVIGVLGRLGPRASAAVPALVAVARNTKSVYRFKAIQAVTRIDPGHKAILPILIALLSVEPPPNEPSEGEDDRERPDIITMIGRTGVRALPAVPSLVRALAGYAWSRTKLLGVRQKERGRPSLGPDRSGGE